MVVMFCVPVKLITSVAEIQSVQHTVIPEGSTMSNKGTLNFKITCKGIRPVSKDSLQGDVSNDGRRDKVNSTESTLTMSTASLSSPSRKRRADMPLNCHTVKKQKLEGNLKLRCGSILKELMSISGAWIFSKPVDPVELKIPDYFSIVTNPMDLGTIKRKLEGNAYSCTEEFASDVRLTFDNAMLYNPPLNEVHLLAKKFSDHFTRRWKNYEACMKRKNDKVHHFDSSDFKKTDRLDTQRSVETNYKAVGNKAVRFEDSSVSEHSMPSRPMPLNEKRKLRLGVAPKRCSSVVRTVQKEQSGRSAFPASKRCQPSKCFSCDGQPCSCMYNSFAALAKCSSCDSQPCSCMPKSDISSERSTEHDRSGTSEGINSSGSVSLDVHLSPNKALRAAMLKSRYADTIYKAKQQGHQDNNSEKLDTAKLQKERERFERQQQEEKARIEAKIKTTQEASMLQRERERAAARILLQNVEKTVEIDENHNVMKDLELLCYGSSSYKGGGILRVNHLEKLGLCMKEDDEEDDEFDATILNAEEGEIL